MSNRTDIVVETDNAEGQVLLSASRVYDLTEDKTQDTINGEVGSSLTSLGNTLNQLSTEVGTVENSIAIIINGNTSTSNVTSGQYVYLKNSTITGKADGLYTYNGTATKTAGNTFAASELDAVPGGIGNMPKVHFATHTYSNLANSNSYTYYIKLTDNPFADLGIPTSAVIFSVQLGGWADLGGNILSVIYSVSSHTVYLLFPKGTTFSGGHIELNIVYIL